MPKKKNEIAAGLFKAKCLQLINEVNHRHIQLTITKHGKPVAKLVPFTKEAHSLYGCLKDSVTINSDIVNDTGEEWDADN